MNIKDIKHLIKKEHSRGDIYQLKQTKDIKLFDDFLYDISYGYVGAKISRNFPIYVEVDADGEIICIRYYEVDYDDDYPSVDEGVLQPYGNVDKFFKWLKENNDE